MTYLQDKKNKNKKFTNIIFGVLIVLIFFFFRVGIFNSLSSVTHFVFKPVLSVGNSIGDKFRNIESFFFSKKTLLKDNDYWKARVNEEEAKMANYNSLLLENESLKEIMGRKGNKEMIIAGILSKPNKSIYDTLVIDAGTNDGIILGKNVFALGDVPIGRIAEVYANSSKVILFSNPGEKTEVVIAPGQNSTGAPGKNIFMEAVGRGGGNFEMILPRDFVLDTGTEASLPGLNPFVLAKVQTILSDPRDSYAKALLSSPVNIQQQKFVEVEK